MSVLQLTRRLAERPLLVPAPGVRLRHYEGSTDMAIWLELRHRAFHRLQAGVGRWGPADFCREFLDKPWWQPSLQWFAVSEPDESTVGTVTLARRGAGESAKPVVHWLAVAPRYRRRGVGRLLMTALEAAVWDSGGRQIWLETHESWLEAGRLYRSLGYEPQPATREP
jgi:GNAT superfamily N-acetyltransferase